ncbi:MAG: hypothetical protein U0Q16_21940 [Bryobacteraceae bacterium]
MATESIHNPFDRAMKAFPDEAPRVFLHMLGIVPLSASVVVTPLRPETAPPVVFPDYVALLEIRAERTFLFHSEFQLQYKDDIPAKMARYGGSFICQHDVEVDSALVLLQPKGVPAEIPKVGEYMRGRTRIQHEFTTIRMWELDPDLIVDSNDPRLFPWAVLMKSSDEQVRKMGEILGRGGDEESIWRFLTLGSLRYDRDWLDQALGGEQMTIVEAIMEGSSIVREFVEKGEARGVEKGLEQGRAEEARRLLRSALAAKFAGLEAMPEIDQIANVEALERLLISHVLESADRGTVERAVRSAATPQ